MVNYHYTFIIETFHSQIIIYNVDFDPQISVTDSYVHCRIAAVEETTFHLLHLSLMREYVDYEFSPVRVSIWIGTSFY